MAQNQGQAQESRLEQKSEVDRSGRTLVDLLNLKSLIAPLWRHKRLCSLLVSIRMVPKYIAKIKQ